MIARNGQRLLKLVNSLLDFSRLESGGADPALSRSTSPQLHGRAREHVPVRRRECRARASTSIARRLPEPVYIDREMWAKIVLNLLSNALKFTFEGTISVRVDHDDALPASRSPIPASGLRRADQAPAVRAVSSRGRRARANVRRFGDRARARRRIGAAARGPRRGGERARGRQHVHGRGPFRRRPSSR